MSLKNSSLINLLEIRVRELELAVGRILRIINDWHPIEEPVPQGDDLLVPDEVEEEGALI